MHTFKRTLATLAAVAGLLVTAVAVGCGDSSPSAQNQADSTVTLPSAQTQPDSTVTSPDAQTPDANAPWYPSLQAFEHYDSARSHVFSEARFGGSFNGSNRVRLHPTKEGAYPSGYNMSYLNANAAFIQGGSYGNVENSIGPYVAKVDPKTLKPVWYTQLVNTKQTGEWDYPGAMAIMNDGYIYVVSGYRIFKADPSDGKVVKTLELPTKVYIQTNYPQKPPTYASTLTENAVNTSYNGLNALPDGTLVLKSLYRVAGCTKDGPTAILNCPNSRDVPASNLISVDPKTMKIIDKITLPAFAGARPTITRYRGVDYVYLLEKISNAVRYSVKNGKFTLDTGWTPAAVPYANQTTGGSLIVMNDWILGATNSVPAAGALTMFAINQDDASKVFLLQPYVNDKLPPEISKVFATAADGKPAVSWAGMSQEADAENGLFYGVIGPRNQRVWVGTDIPGAEIPGQNKTDRVVFRDAATGRELARSKRVPFMTQGSAIQPGYGGSVFFLGAKGTLVKVTPSPN